MNSCPLRFGLLFVLALTWGPRAQGQLEAPDYKGYELTAEEVARYAKYFPKTLPKLQQHLPVHVVVLGDSVANKLGYGDDGYDWLKSFHATFIDELSRQFFYPGGVRLIKQRKGKPTKEDEVIGAEITLRNMARNGSTSLHAFQRLTTDAFFNKPDIVIINYGINDALAGVSLDVYKEAISGAVDIAKSKGAEVILLGPAVIIADFPALRAMSITRPYSAVAREIAEEKGVFYADLGDISALVGGTTPGTPVEQVERNIEFAMRDYFDHGADVVDFIHPNTLGHRLIGKKAFRKLSDPKPVDYVISQSTAEIDGEKMILRLSLANRTQEKRTVIVVPMPFGKAYETQEAARELELDAEGETEIVLEYTSKAEEGSPSGFRYDLLPAFEPFVRGSIICTDETQTLFADFKATITPVAFNWRSGAQYNVSKKFSLGGDLMNTGSTPLTANFTAEWEGQRGTGSAIVPPGGKHSLTFEFQFPGDPDVFRKFSEAILTVDAGGKKHRFRRGVEVSRNLGLNQTIEMTDISPVPSDNAESQTVQFRADVDDEKKALYLIFDMKGFDILTTADAPTGLLADIAIDARGYGKRQTFGFVDGMRISTGSSDGAGECSKFWPASFGNGYALEIDEEKISSRLQSLPGGIRRLTVAVPRNYFYNHEFAVGNGNSQLGIDALLSIQVKDVADPLAVTSLRYGILSCGVHKNNAQSLTTLELSKPATQRWSVRIF